jgi:hypothetical protein
MRLMAVSRCQFHRRDVADGLGQQTVVEPSTQSRVANSIASRLRHGPGWWMTSVLNRPMIDSVGALSCESPTLPTDGATFHC